MSPRKYLAQMMWPFKRYLRQLVPRSLGFNLRVRYGLVNFLVCVLFGSKWMTLSQPCRNDSNSELRIWHETMQLLPEFTCDYWLSVVKMLWTQIMCVVERCKHGIIAEIWTCTTSRGLDVCHRNLLLEQAKIRRIIQEKWGKLTLRLTRRP
jgi:hypothetical protein